VLAISSRSPCVVACASRTEIGFIVSVGPEIACLHPIIRGILCLAAADIPPTLTLAASTPGEHIAEWQALYHLLGILVREHCAAKETDGRSAMAMGLTFICGQCGKTFVAWDEGNPYYLDSDGRKHYAYHPRFEELARCVGNDSPYVCLSCGEKFMVDSRDPLDRCPSCDSSGISDLYALNGKPCPFCSKGTFSIDESNTMIS
jgi:DNA-directed RNA polymerase subunit RPC12/RpoP